MKMLMGGPERSRTRRMLLGKLPVVGVAGRTLTEWCGLRGWRGVLEMVVEMEPLEEVELALLWLWWWVLCMDRMEETEDEVDFRPRSPAGPEVRRTAVARGVSGEGESERRLYGAAAGNLGT